MRKAYRCKQCGRECIDAVYLRLVLTRCGLKQAKKHKRHLAIPIAHVCWECLHFRVRTATGSEEAITQLRGFLAI
jgi:hypothetical protein